MSFSIKTVLFTSIGLLIGISSYAQQAPRNHQEFKIQVQAEVDRYNAESCNRDSVSACLGRGFATHHYAFKEGWEDAKREAKNSACRDALQKCLSISHGKRCHVDRQTENVMTGPQEFPIVIQGATCVAQPRDGYDGPEVKPD